MAFASQVAHAASIRILDQGASAAGQLMRLPRRPDPSALYYNPAGMTQLRGIQIYAGTTLIGGHTNYTGVGGECARSGHS